MPSQRGQVPLPTVARRPPPVCRPRSIQARQLATALPPEEPRRMPGSITGVLERTPAERRGAQPPLLSPSGRRTRPPGRRDSPDQRRRYSGTRWKTSARSIAAQETVLNAFAMSRGTATLTPPLSTARCDSDRTNKMASTVESCRLNPYWWSEDLGPRLPGGDGGGNQNTFQ